MAMILAGLPVQAQDSGAARLEALAQQMRRSYQIAKSTCLVMSGSQSELHSVAVVTISDEFQDVMTGLIDGDAAQGLNAENDPDLRANLQEVQLNARGLTASASQIVAGDFHSVPVGMLLIRNQEVADQIEYALMAAVPTYAPTSQSKEIGVSIRMLERQRARVEQLLRDLCYARLNIGPADLVEQMRAEMLRFEQVNTALIIGDAELGVEKAPNISVKIALGQVESKWASLRALLEAAVQGGEQDVRDVQLASVIGETMSQKLSKLIEAYSKI
ncbi:MAG: hypothetical protein ACSHXB_12185 [Sulfitobacter sp.]